MNSGCTDTFSGRPQTPSTCSYLHLLQTPLSKIWQYSEASYQAWTEELLGYEQRRTMNQSSRGGGSGSGNGKQELTVVVAAIIEEEEYMPMRQEDGEELEKGARVEEDHVNNVMEGVEGLELGEDDYGQAGSGLDDQSNTNGQTVPEGCLSCQGQTPSGEGDAGLWGLYCGHAFHPDCLRQYLRTCWQSCQPRDNNPLFVCPQCGDRLDSTWCKALIGSGGFS